MNLLGFVKARPIMMLGIVLILVGFAGPTVLATVHIDATPPIIETTFPSGSYSSPTILVPGRAYEIYAIANDRGSGIASATVTINGVKKTLTRSAIPFYILFERARCRIWNWPAPSSGRVTFVWTLKDYAGNVRTKTTYASSAIPAGDFYINGTKVTTSTSLTLTTRTLTLKFIATSGASSITKVRIVVAGQLDKTKTSTTGISSYQETWTAPRDGTYTINCYFTAGGKNYQVASIMAGLNTEPEPIIPVEVDEFTWVGIAGIVLVVFGIVVKH